MVSLRMVLPGSPALRHYCGGTLIDTPTGGQAVLTAGHCCWLLPSKGNPGINLAGPGTKRYDGAALTNITFPTAFIGQQCSSGPADGGIKVVNAVVPGYYPGMVELQASPIHCL